MNQKENQSDKKLLELQKQEREHAKAHQKKIAIVKEQDRKQTEKEKIFNNDIIKQVMDKNQEFWDTTKDLGGEGLSSLY